jgi:hypothetical protein
LNKSLLTVARAIRMELDPLTGDLYLVFKIIDNGFKQRVREDWSKDIKLKILGKDLVIDGDDNANI